MKRITKYALALALICGPVGIASAQTPATPGQTVAAPAQKQGKEAVLEAYAKAEQHADDVYNSAVHPADEAYTKAKTKANQEMLDAIEDGVNAFRSANIELNRAQDAAVKAAKDTRNEQVKQAKAAYAVIMDPIEKMLQDSYRDGAKARDQAHDKARHDYGVATTAIRAANDTAMKSARSIAERDSADRVFRAALTKEEEDYQAATEKARKDYSDRTEKARNDYSAAEDPASKTYESVVEKANSERDAAVTAALIKNIVETGKIQQAYRIAIKPASDAYKIAIKPATEAFKLAVQNAEGVRETAREKRVEIWNLYTNGKKTADEAVAELEALSK
jgi:hypothetical protein